jgi:predicted MPP superfamily phosphohydrolase
MLERAFDGVLPEEPVIMLTHNPDLIDVPALAAHKPDLVLAGHTHGGQFGIDFIRKYSDYAERSKYMAGLFRVSDMRLYVNRGLGMKTRRIRFFCRPEVTVFRFN